MLGGQVLSHYPSSTFNPGDLTGYLKTKIFTKLEQDTQNQQTNWWELGQMFAKVTQSKIIPSQCVHIFSEGVQGPCFQRKYYL